MLCVEAAVGHADFELQKDDADILIQLKTSSVFWQKERLLNVGLKHLPKDCDKIVWLDADIIFYNDRWIEETCELLESYIIVQPFSFNIRLPREVYSISPDKLPFGDKESRKYYSSAYRIAHIGRESLHNKYIDKGQSGFAWAARKNILDKHGFYDRLILGGGDVLMEYAFYGAKSHIIQEMSSKKMTILQDKWADKVYQDVKGSISYTGGEILHLWHGSFKNKFHKYKRKILKKYNFDPHSDIKIDANGCWRWTTDKRDLHRWIKKYFWVRNEDGSFLREIILFFYTFKWSFYSVKDKMLGFLGIFLKYNCPKIYFLLKKIKNGSLAK